MKITNSKWDRGNIFICKKGKGKIGIDLQYLDRNIYKLISFQRQNKMS